MIEHYSAPELMRLINRIRKDNGRAILAINNPSYDRVIQAATSTTAIGINERQLMALEFIILTAKRQRGKYTRYWV